MPRAKLTYKEISRPKKHQPHKKGVFDWFFGNPFMRETFKKWSAHGLVPVVLGALVVIDGHSAIQIRSIAVLVCASWLALDIGIEISAKNWSGHQKLIWFSALTCICFCGAMYVMRWFLISELEEQQKDVWQKFDAIAYLPPNQDAWDSIFTVTNNGKTDIGDHTISCIPNRIVTDHFVVIEGPTSLGMVHDWPKIQIKGGGDSQTDNCLHMPFSNTGLISCADITLSIEYELTTQPGISMQKKWRFVTSKSEGEWHKQSLDYSGFYCLKP